jgi:hypothetical protein
MMYPMVRMSDGVHIRAFPGERALLLSRGVARDVVEVPDADSTQPAPPRKQARKRKPRAANTQHTNE